MYQATDFQALFLQLQARYPMTSLITELVQCQEGQFVVRALVQSSGIAIVTGLAAASTVELAEDQARLRVLSLLGIGSTEQSAPSSQLLSVASTPSYPTNEFVPLPPLTPSPWVEPELPLTNGSNLVRQSAIAEVATQPSTTQTFEDDRVPEYLVDEIADSSFSEVPQFEDYGVPASEVGDELPTLSSSPVESQSNRPKPKKVAMVEPAIAPSEPEPEPEPISEEPDDLSSLIALTDIEMDRIGWTKQEGREYLKRTYKKSTRQRLDVDELMDFLNYLRALPSLNGL